MIFIILFSAVLFMAAVCVVSKAGEKDGICKYGNSEEDKHE